MGNHQNNGNNNNNHQNQLNVQHLTNDPNYQQVLRDLYANNSSQILQDFPQYQHNQDQHPNHFKNNVIIKTAKPKKNDICIKKESLQLVQKDDSTYQIEFIFDCSDKIILKIHFLSKETINSEFITQKIDSLKFKSYEYQSGQGIIFKDFIFDIREIKLEDLETIDQDRRQFPLIIEINTNQKKYFSYCYFKIAQTELQLHCFSTKLEINGKAFTVKDVYGGLKDQDKECVICLSSKVNTIILPCNHMSLCEICCQGLKARSSKCPICRNKIKGFTILVKDQ